MFLYQSSQQTTVKKRTLGNTNSARTDEVFNYLSTAAIPANPKALARIQNLLREDRDHSPSDRGEITKEIIADPGLGLYYLSNLRSALEIEVLPEDPLLPLHTMPISNLRDFFKISASQISKYKITDAGPPQLLRYQHSFIASVSAAHLSRQYLVDQGKTFSLVQICQSALNLLAWSYPNQFHKALFNKKRFKASIEESLNSFVGVKAENLVNKLAKKIGLPNSILLDLQMSQRPGSIDISAVPPVPSALSLARFGDLLAKANDKEHFPEAFPQWERVEKQLAERGIQSPVHEIHASIKEFIYELEGESSIPYQMAIFQTQLPKESEVIPSFADPESLNPYFKKLPDQLKNILKIVYENISPGALSVKALQVLVEEFVPAINANSGCLYLAKGDKLLLQPTLQFGKIKKLRQSLSVHANHPIAQSLFSNLPQRFDSGPGEVSICGSLLDSQKQAVLLLEYESNALRDLGEKSFSIFNALATAFVDTLGQRRKE